MTEAFADSVLGGRYRLVRSIAAGGMGLVWEAEDTVLHRPVAVKMLSNGLAADPRSVQRFRREALAAAGLSHPNVASVFDFGENGGPPFIVMELVDGETLSDRIRREGRLAPPEAVRIAIGIAAALQAAHDAGVVHRDVKPGNVMLTPAGEVKVLDFGISAAAGAPLTATGARMGTATYLAPEQASGEPPSPASDVYSLGVVLYEMLTGRAPFVGESPVAVASMHLDRPPPSVRGLAPDVPAALAAACERALTKNPADRPASAAAFAAMLAGVGGADPSATITLPPAEPTGILPAGILPAGTPSTPAPAAPRRRGPRRRGLLAIAAVLALAAAVVAGVLVFMAVSGKGSSPSARVTVPAVVGLPRAAAEAALRSAGLSFREVLPEHGPADVVSQVSPPAGSQVAPGSTVTLYLGPTSNGGDHGPGQGHGKGKGGD